MFWTFTACLLIGIMRQEHRPLDIVGRTPQALAETVRKDARLSTGYGGRGRKRPNADEVKGMSALSGIRVVELARILAGPWIGQTLADLGADVIKVESPEGDDTRRWGPPFVETDGERTAAYYHACNRGKRGIVADFTTARGREIALRLALRSDVLIENFKVGGPKKYDLDYETLSALNPRLVYCSVTGFGQTGPY